MATEKRMIAYDPITFESFTRHATKHREPYDHYDMGYTDAVYQIEDWLDANTVDAVEVVRCKNCVHMKVKFNARFCEIWCMFNGMGDEGFCNYGERNDGDQS